MAGYFDPFARAYEFSAGGIIAVLDKFFITYKNNNIPLLSLILFFAIGPVFGGGQANFPGAVGIIPCLVASGILLFYNDNSKSNLFFSKKIFLVLGKLTFPFYLIHWPVYVIFFVNNDYQKLDFLSGLYVFAISFIASALLYLFVKFSTKFVKSFSLVFWILFLLFNIGFTKIYLADGISFEDNVKKYYADVHYASPNAKVNIKLDSSKVVLDEGGDTNAHRAIFLIGASHTDNWVNVFKKFGKTHHYKVIAIIKSACYFSELSETYQACKDWNKNVLDYLNGISDPANHYIVTTLTQIVSEKGKKAIETYPSFKSTLMNKLMKKGFNIVGLRDVPRFSEFLNPAECFILNPDRCSVSKPDICNDRSYNKIVSTNKNINFLDFNFPFCDENKCRAVINDPVNDVSPVLVFGDQHGHLRQQVVMEFYKDYENLLEKIFSE